MALRKEFDEGVEPHLCSLSRMFARKAAADIKT
jgi:hypothetical protein